MQKANARLLPCQIEQESNCYFLIFATKNSSFQRLAIVIEVSKGLL